MTTATLDFLVRNVAQARATAASLKANVDEARRQWEEEQATLLDVERMATALVAVVETELRNAALAAYAATQGKRPHPALSIHIGYRVLYDPRVAKEWSLTHGAIAHKFDAKAFENLARAGHTGSLGKLQAVPQATIAQDLSEYIVPVGPGKEDG